MRFRGLVLTSHTRHDLTEIWSLVDARDGKERADSVIARFQVFFLSLQEFAFIGTRHDECRPGLRSAGVPGLKTAAVLFRVL